MQFDVDICCLYLSTKKLKGFYNFDNFIGKLSFLGLDTLFGRTRHMYVTTCSLIFDYITQLKYYNKHALKIT